MERFAGGGCAVVVNVCGRESFGGPCRKDERYNFEGPSISVQFCVIHSFMASLRTLGSPGETYAHRILGFGVLTRSTFGPYCWGWHRSALCLTRYMLRLTASVLL